MFNYNALTGISPNALMPQQMQAGPGQTYSMQNFAPQGFNFAQGWNAPSPMANPAYRPAPTFQPQQQYYGGIDIAGNAPRPGWSGNPFAGMNWNPQGAMFDPRYYGPPPQAQVGTAAPNAPTDFEMRSPRRVGGMPNFDFADGYGRGQNRY